ncbi:hypothetical protein [Bordetella avium]|uniref:hypothetical protein n=1 Tax=Bordetella avium TaxID=521 RepID=UPI00057AB1B0|nr:hypothetical protein [Bordetella avium]
MTTVTKFFEDNIKRLGSANRDPLAWNLNYGLLALAKQIDEIEQRQRATERALQDLAAQIRSQTR